MQKNWTIRLTTFALWCLAAASVVYWGLRFVQGTSAPAHAAVVAAAPSTIADSAALARALGGGLPNTSTATSTAVVSTPEPTQTSIVASRFVLTGIVDAKPASQSLALIGVDAKPARPYRVGAQIADGIVIRAIRTREVVLSTTTGSANSAKVTLELPKLGSAAGSAATPGAPARPGPGASPAVPGPAPVFAPPAISVPAPTPAPVAAPGVSANPPVSVDAATGLPTPNTPRGASARLRAMREAGREPAKEEPATQAGTVQ